MLVIEEKVLRDLEIFEKCVADRDHDKKKVVAEVQSLLDKATAMSKKKDSEIAHLHKELVDDHSDINSDEFHRYLRKHRAADLAAQKAKVIDHGGMGSQPNGSLDN
ncbi:hypothetical protein Adt_10524 [Abeliophyllum distichum]|uniref:Uncharacterized protein n=1 Tax=Abeliophyllum distichum TaxID=126358 RepID=A0ABD1ULP9_9LAMI